MRARILVAAVAVTAVAVAPAAHAVAKAKPKLKTYCMSLTDATGDGKSAFVPVIASPELDVISGDIATGAKTMVAVLRLGSTDVSVTTDPWSHSGYSWFFGAVSTLGTNYGFTAAYGIFGDWTFHATVDNVGVPVDAKIVGNTIQWTIQRKSSPNLARPGNVLHQFRGGSEVESTTADDALTTTTTYPDRAASCVHAS